MLKVTARLNEFWLVYSVRPLYIRKLKLYKEKTIYMKFFNGVLAISQKKLLKTK